MITISIKQHIVPFKHIALLTIFHINITPSTAINTWIQQNSSTGALWKSTSDFNTSGAEAYGNITLSHIMSMEFDFIFTGRTNYPRIGYDENFFRVGGNAEVYGDGCDGEGSRYPSLWLSGNTDTLFVSVTDGDLPCETRYTLAEFGVLTTDTSYHMKIAFNDSILQVIINDSWTKVTKLWSRSPTTAQKDGRLVDVWWSSNVASGTDYNYGGAVFSNIILISGIFSTDTLESTTSYETTLYETTSTLQSSRMNYTISITFNDCNLLENDGCDIDDNKMRDILIAVVPDAQVLSSEVIDKNTMFVTLSITTDEYNTLDTDVMNEMEMKLEDEYGSVDVNIPKPETTNRDQSVGSVKTFSKTVVIAIVIVLCGACCIISICVFVKQFKKRAEFEDSTGDDEAGHQNSEGSVKQKDADDTNDEGDGYKQITKVCIRKGKGECSHSFSAEKESTQFI